MSEPGIPEGVDWPIALQAVVFCNRTLSHPSDSALCSAALIDECLNLTVVQKDVPLGSTS